MAKKVTNEEIIAALLSRGTVRGAAEVTGMSERGIYDRMNKGEFIALYKAAKADIVRGAVISLNSQIQEAVQTVVDVMTDTSNNAAIRLQAAQTILNNAGKFSQRLQVEEQSVTAQLEANAWF